MNERPSQSTIAVAVDAFLATMRIEFFKRYPAAAPEDCRVPTIDQVSAQDRAMLFRSIEQVLIAGEKERKRIEHFQELAKMRNRVNG
jgi:hypothetical protein